MEEFGDVLLREVAVMDSNVSAQSVRNVIASGRLSWAVVEGHRKEFVVEILKDIDDLDESQCNELFDKMDRMVPIDPEEARRKSVLSMKRVLYEKWIMKCMYVHVVFQCFQMLMYLFLSF